MGMPKSGSTALQLALAKDGLLANEADGYRRISWGMDVAGFHMKHHAYERVTPLVGDVPHGQVISDENLTIAEHRESLRLLAAFDPDVVLLVVRDFPDLVESWWAMLVRHGETRDLASWCADVLFADPYECVDSRRVRADYVAQVWQPNVVIPYRRDLLEWFANNFLNGHNFSYAGVANKSLSAEATEALRRWQIRHNVSHDLLQVAAKRLPKIDAPKLMSVTSSEVLMRYDSDVREAIGNLWVAKLPPVQITTRNLDEDQINVFLREIEKS